VLALGIQGAIRREAKGSQLAAALHALAQGLSVIDPAFLPRRASTKRAKGLLSPLTAREQQVLLLLAEGGSNKEIADRLKISERTAKFHVNAILQKLSADRRTDAVVRAARLGLITL
jgi:DNA-binding NarL/FixJ family response regulator